MQRRLAMLGMTMIALCLCAACESSPQRERRVSIRPVGAYYTHHYADARDALRDDAADRRSADVVLDNLRLGLASMADGDHLEAERSLLRAYEYLISGGVNAPDRAVSSTVIYEGIKVWKGEPYEQAMAFYDIAALYMIKGDWENARAAAQNALFALRDFGGHGDEAINMRDVAEEAARADKRGGDYVANARTIESQFTLGYLIAATAERLNRRPEAAAPMFDRVRQLRPDLAPLADALQRGDFDTLLLIDEGHGPTKEAYGRDDALIRYVPDGRGIAPPHARVSVDGGAVAHTGDVPVVDLWTLSQYPKWWSVESIRHAKSVLGDVFLIGGAVAADVGSHRDNETAQWAGIAAVLAGLAMKATAQADTRHLEFLPRCVFVVPLKLGGGRHDVRVHFEGHAGSDATWNDLIAGTPDAPRVYYLRMHDGAGRGMPAWADHRLYSITADTYDDGPPWIMGGDDMTPPSDELMRAYHARGALPNMNASALRDLYSQEGFVFTPGPQGRDDKAGRDPQWYRHVTEGGRVLFAPPPGTHMYQRLTRTEHGSYEPRSAQLRSIMQQPTQGREQPAERGNP